MMIQERPPIRERPPVHPVASMATPWPTAAVSRLTKATMCRMARPASAKPVLATTARFLAAMAMIPATRLPASHCVLYGKSVEHGTRVTAYDLPQARPGQPCVSEERVCNNGTLSGNYVYDSCTGEGGSDGDSGDDSGTDSGGDSTGTDGSSTTDSGTTNDSGTTTGNPPPLPEFDILAVPASFTLAGLWLARSKKRRSARKNRKQDS